MTTRKQLERQARELRAIMRVSTFPGLDVEVTAPDGFVWAEMGTRVLVGAGDAGGTSADVWADLSMRMDSGLRPLVAVEEAPPALDSDFVCEHGGCARCELRRVEKRIEGLEFELVPLQRRRDELEQVLAPKVPARHGKNAAKRGPRR